MRLTSQMWIAALMRRIAANGGYATLLFKGDPQAGAIFVVERYHGEISCWAPAPQAVFMNGDDGEGLEYGASERLFECVKAACSQEEAASFIARQRDFDSDCHVVEVEGCRADLPVAVDNPRERLDQQIRDRFGNIFRK